MRWLQIFAIPAVVVTAFAADQAITVGGDRAKELSREDISNIVLLCKQTRPSERLWAVVTDKSPAAPNQMLRATVYFYPTLIQSRLRTGSAASVTAGVSADKFVSIQSRQGRWISSGAQLAKYAQVAIDDSQFLNAPGDIRDPQEGPFFVANEILDADIVSIVDSLRAFLRADPSSAGPARRTHPITIMMGSKSHAEVWSSGGDKHFDTYVLDKHGEKWSISKTGQFDAQ
ncbi:MAG: hypothetical protein ACJ8NS_05575 [Chthoniobacterales bacterium]